jgi:hypothetical protein
LAHNDKETRAGVEPAVAALQSGPNPRKTRGESGVFPSCQQIAGTERETDADLQAISDAWPALPDAIKAGILAMVKATM